MTTASRDELGKAYNPAEVESRRYAFWEEHGWFRPEAATQPDKEPFCIIMPPPNVTGELHLGHALVATLSDTLVRWHRMRGHPTLWLPGEDHASIAAQWVMEQELAKEGRTRQELGRQGFLNRMWDWMNKYRHIIMDQHKRLGTSCDWSRERFTMDPGPSRATLTTFVNYYHQGLIYRGHRIINWCPRCMTALSDLEVDHDEDPGALYYVRYQIVGADGSPLPPGEAVPPATREGPQSSVLSPQPYITVATTRPETILGDVAVAVNPDDPRYRDVIGLSVTLPMLGRTIPVIADAAVDPAFGTGALKITPAHDPVDFEVGQRHGLPQVVAMNLDATMNGNAGRYAGMDRYTCRDAILHDLEDAGLLDHVDPTYVHSVGHCYRCRTVVEPIISEQWFLNVQEMARRATEAVRSGEIQIVPQRFEKVYYNWMDNIRDWCISRQLWWGHRIPAWYCRSCPNPPIVQILPPATCPNCGSSDIEQDPDVLDTWFSSGLWPHSTLGWPDDTEDLRRFYPTSVMVTGYDILFFWVARMIMMGIQNTGRVPFRTVYLHGLIRDEHGEKMSKSKGNVISPVETIETYGTDALRFTLATGSTPGNDMKLNNQRIEGSRNFANKLWNASRFVLSNLPTDRPVDPMLALDANRPAEDRWIISRLHQLIANQQDLLAGFQLGEAGRQLNDFLWSEFCDWYIEMAKIRLRGTAEQGNSGAADHAETRRRGGEDGRERTQDSGFGTQSTPPPPGEGSLPAQDSGLSPESSPADPRPVLAYVLETSLRLLHPFMPFITEELWQALKPAIAWEGAPPEALIIAPYPAADLSRVDPAAEAEVNTAIDVIRAIRNARAERNVPPGRWIQAQVFSGPAVAAGLRRQGPSLRALARVDALQFFPDDAPRPGRSVPLVQDNCEVYLPLAGLIDLSQERARLEKELAQERTALAQAEAKLGNPAFTDRAPAAVVEKERERLNAARERVERLEARLREVT